MGQLHAVKTVACDEENVNQLPFIESCTILRYRAGTGHNDSMIRMLHHGIDHGQHPSTHFICQVTNKGKMVEGEG